VLFQICVLPIASVLLLHLSIIQFVCSKFLNFIFHNFYYCNEGRAINCCNGWFDFEIIHVVFKTKVFKKYHGTFNWIADRNIEDLGSEYLNCYMQNIIALIWIILKMKSPHIVMHVQICKITCLCGLKTLALNQNRQKVLRKVTCMLSL
jgi:hypothetical protein